MKLKQKEGVYIFKKHVFKVKPKIKIYYFTGWCEREYYTILENIFRTLRRIMGFKTAQDNSQLESQAISTSISRVLLSPLRPGNFITKIFLFYENSVKPEAVTIYGGINVGQPFFFL